MTDKDLFKELLTYLSGMPTQNQRLIAQLKLRVEEEQTQKTDHEKFIDFWSPTIGIEAAEKAWEDKQAVPYRQANMVMGDIQPYISQIDGSVINSRSKHRTHLRDHGCIEVGNEKQTTTAKMPTYDPALKQRIIDVTNSKLGY
jgi:hypothetical protein